MYPTPLRYREWPNNGHLKKIEEAFGPTVHGYEDDTGVDRFVFICFTNRSGSNYLAEVIASDGQLPNAGENLNWDTVLEQSRQSGLSSIQEYFSHLAKQTAKNGVVSIKAAPPHIEILGKSGILDSIIDRSHFIVIERADKLGQAISHDIAFQTRQFTSLMSSDEPENDPEFDPQRLDAILNNISKSYDYFNRFFSSNGIVPLHVSYEQFVDDPHPYLEFIGEKIGFGPLEIHENALRLKKQRGARNEAWRTAYLQGVEKPL